MDQNTSPTEALQQTRPLKPSSSENEFSTGDTVFYGIHGRCTVTALETRTISKQQVQFYRLEVQRTVPANTHKKDTAIWLPVANAAASGPRAPLHEKESQSVFEILGNGEYYFSLKTGWPKIQAELEAAIRKEGACGLAKVESYLFVMKDREVAPPKAMIRFTESVHRLLLRELSEATGEQPKDLETRIEKMLRQKLRPDM